MKLCLMLSMLLLVGVAYGQLSPVAGSPAAPAPAIGGTGAGLGAPNIPGAPFSADTITESLRPSPDGNKAYVSNQGKLLRDSQGRTRRELDVLSGSGTIAGRNVVITDPVQHLMIVMNSSDKVARVYHWQSPVPSVHSGGTPASANLPASQAWPAQAGNIPGATIQARPAGTLTALSSPSQAMAVKSDNLGQKELQGVLVTGTKITRTMTADSLGNLQPSVSTTETWVSPELKVTILTEIDDPSGGQTVTKLMNIQRSEPDPSLFQVPSEYTVEDTAKK